MNIRFWNCLSKRRDVSGLNTCSSTRKIHSIGGDILGMAKYFAASYARIGIDVECTSQ